MKKIYFQRILIGTLVLDEMEIKINVFFHDCLNWCREFMVISFTCMQMHDI